MASMDFAAQARHLRTMLTTDILPWWLRNAMDDQHGGICTCIGDDGAIHSQDKYVWSQVRALWTFAAAYRRIEPRPEYRQAADQLFEFCCRYGRNMQGDWLFLLAPQGQVKEGPTSIQTDAFALCALVEYAQISSRPEVIPMAMQTYRRTLEKLGQPGSYTTKPYPIPPGAKAQRVSMQFSLAYSDLARLTGDWSIHSQAMKLVDDVLDHFRQPQLQAIMEYVSQDNRLLEPPAGTYISPGHGIETAWFQIENLRRLGDWARLCKAVDIARWSLQRGWDQTYGGLYLGMDLHGGQPYLPNGEAKIWWPHCEAICGTLMAYEVCRESWCLDWYDKVLAWSLDHFPNREHGEWTQRLDRQGRPINTVVALPVKDPFHLPRALIYAIESLERLQES